MKIVELKSTPDICDIDSVSQRYNLQTASKLIKKHIFEFRDAEILQPGMLVNHPLIGDATIVSIKGNDARVKSVRDLKIYRVQLSSLQIGSLEITETNKSKNISPGNNNTCWKNYKQVGTKTKNGKIVPNCVPVEEGGQGGINRAAPAYDVSFEKVLDDVYDAWKGQKVKVK